MPTLTKPTVQKRPASRTETPEVPALSAPPKLRRRPVALLVSVATIVAGSMLGLWVWSAAGSTTEVIAVRTLVHRGEVITPEDLMVVRVGVDPAVRTVEGTRLEEVAGQRAALDLAPGGLLAPDDVAATVLPAKGTSLVGIGLTDGMLPAEPLAPGDAVRIVQTPGAQGEVVGTPVTIPAEVVGVHPADASGLTIVDVLVPSEAAADLAARAATGKVALVLDSRER